jgi:hypothetical protein
MGRFNGWMKMGIAAVKTREYEHYYFFGAEVLRCLGMCGGVSSLRASSCLVLYVMRFTT